MHFTLYTQPDCIRCEAVKRALTERGHSVEVLTQESLAAMTGSTAEIMRRADLMAQIQMRDSDELPVVFRDDEIIEIEELELGAI